MPEVGPWLGYQRDLAETGALTTVLLAAQPREIRRYCEGERE
jgi:hypothetical protein